MRWERSVIYVDWSVGLHQLLTENMDSLCQEGSHKTMYMHGSNSPTDCNGLQCDAILLL